MKVRFFVFLELMDQEINSLLLSLRRIFMEETPSTNIHITIRGPYEDEPTPAEIETFHARLNKRLQDSRETLLIHGVRAWKTEPDMHHVALRLQCEALKSVWWKPDYPIEKFGFNPHITLYSGRDRRLSQAVAEFLTNEELAVICREFRIGTHISGQRLFKFDNVEPDGGEDKFRGLIELRHVKAGILSRATKLMLPYIREALEKDLVRTRLP